MSAVMHPIALLLLHLTWWATAAYDQPFGVVRPFAYVDRLKLQESFDVWKDQLPCTQKPTVPVDLYLVFSQRLENNAEANAATTNIRQEWLGGNSDANLNSKWYPCFRNVIPVSANLTAAEDTYSVVHSEDDPNWVQGPNKQFLAIATGFESGKFGSYGAWFLMEMDTVPRRDNWLNELLGEVSSRGEFAILGSFFRGDAWDHLIMPPAVDHHINGNAVYKHDNVLMKELLAQFAADMAIPGRVLDAFDVHMAAEYLASYLEADQFTWYYGNSQVIGNYAHTAMLSDYYNNEALVHGGWLYAANTEPVALVVSDFGLNENSGQPALEVFKQLFLSGHHPFREVVIMRPNAPTTATYTGLTNGAFGAETVTFTEKQRTDSVWLDWCNAPVTSQWFMYTNTNMDFARRIDLLRSLTDNKPVLKYVPSDTTYCEEGCHYSINRAASFTGIQMTEHYELTHTLFRTDLRDTLCAEWKTWNTAALAADPARQACDPLPGPTADDYIAYLTKDGQAGIYSLEDAVRRGERDFGIPRYAVWDPRPCAFPSVDISAANSSTCGVIPSESQCLAMEGCAWRSQFDTCFAGALRTVSVPPSLSTSIGYDSNVPADFATPTITLTNNDADALTLDIAVSDSFGTAVQRVTIGAGQSVAVPILLGSSPPAYTGETVLPGILTVTVVNSAPHLLAKVPFEVYDLRPFTVTVSDGHVHAGEPFTLVAGGSGPSTLEVLINPQPTFPVAMVTTIDGWKRTDPAGASIAVDTSALDPAYVTTLTVQTRQTITLGGRTFVKYGTLTVQIQAPMCDTAIAVDKPTVAAGDTITATANGITFSNPPAVPVAYEWTLGAASTVATAVVTTSLPVPLLQAPGTARLTLVAKDATGRTQQCVRDITVTEATYGTAAGVAQQQCTAITTADQAKTCLAVAATLASPTGQQQSDATTLRQTVEGILQRVSTTLVTTSIAETNAALARLEALVGSSSQPAMTASAMDYVVQALSQLVNSSPLDMDMVPYIASIMSAALQRTKASGVLSTGPSQLSLLDRGMKGAVCGDPTFGRVKTSRSADKCVSAVVGWVSTANLPGDYIDLVVRQQAKLVLPDTVRFVLMSVGAGCNAYPGTQTTALRRAMFLHPQTCEPLPRSLFDVSSAAIWTTILSFALPTVPTTTATTTAIAQRSAVDFVRVASSGVSADGTYVRSDGVTVQQMCVPVDMVEGQGDPFDLVSGTCQLSYPSWVTGVWVPVVGAKGLGFESPSPSPLSGAWISTTTTTTTTSESWWIIPVAVCLAILGVCLCLLLAWFLLRRDRKEEEKNMRFFEPDEGRAEAEASHSVVAPTPLTAAARPRSGAADSASAPSSRSASPSGSLPYPSRARSYSQGPEDSVMMGKSVKFSKHLDERSASSLYSSQSSYDRPLSYMSSVSYEDIHGVPFDPSRSVSSMGSGPYPLPPSARAASSLAWNPLAGPAPYAEPFVLPAPEVYGSPYALRRHASLNGSVVSRSVMDDASVVDSERWAPTYASEAAWWGPQHPAQTYVAPAMMGTHAAQWRSQQDFPDPSPYAYPTSVSQGDFEPRRYSVASSAWAPSEWSQSSYF